MAWIGWRGILPGALLLLGLVGLVGGSLLVARRRWPGRPARLSGGRFQFLPALLLFFSLSAALIAFGELGWLPRSADGQPPGQMFTALALVLLATQVAWGL